MKRGDLVTIAVQGDLGKPRPALIIQSNSFDKHETFTVLPMSSTTIDAPLFRITIEPDEMNGLQKISQIMVDKAITIKRRKLGKPFGRIGDKVMLEVTRSLAVFLGIAN
jgi:mRNA interferase MazF